MIQRTATDFQQDYWKTELAQAISQPLELLRLLELESAPLMQALDSQPHFRLRVPLAYVWRMRKKDPADPLLRQVLPLTQENLIAPHEMPDPVGDQASEVLPGVLHKYDGRVLLVSTGACAVHCRYCFRRHFPYSDANPRSHNWQAVVDYLKNDKSIHEVILSGGDPLSLDDTKIATLMQQLRDLPHITRVRIHSRMSIVLPSRITDQLVASLKLSQKQIVFVCHANHANELDDSVSEACDRMQRAGFHLLNQAVLLRGVNADVQSLVDLSEGLFRNQILPYYLHTLDPVQGTAHFDVPLEEARSLHARLRARLPGYLVPRLVKEVSGETAKTPIW